MTRILWLIVLVSVMMTGCVQTAVMVRYQPNAHTSVDVTIYR